MSPVRFFFFCFYFRTKFICSLRTFPSTLCSHSNPDFFFLVFHAEIRSREEKKSWTPSEMRTNANCENTISIETTVFIHGMNSHSESNANNSHFESRTHRRLFSAHSTQWQMIWPTQTLSSMLCVCEAKTRDVFSYEKRVFIRLHFVPHSHSLFPVRMYFIFIFLCSNATLPSACHFSVAFLKVLIFFPETIRLPTKFTRRLSSHCILGFNNESYAVTSNCLLSDSLGSERIVNVFCIFRGILCVPEHTESELVRLISANNAPKMGHET